MAPWPGSHCTACCILLPLIHLSVCILSARLMCDSPRSLGRSCLSSRVADVMHACCTALPSMSLLLRRLQGVNSQLAWSSQNPVGALPPSSKGFHDTLGNAWEWAEVCTRYLPLVWALNE